MTQPHGQQSTSPTPPLEWTVADVVAATGGEVLGPETGARFAGIGIDSRRISAADLFVAIRGETHDGHRFAEDVVGQGCRGLLLARAKLAELPWEKWVAEKVVCIVVEDTIAALGRLAAYHRRRNTVAVAAITGSNGKTTTRQMTAAVVSQRFSTLSTRKNFNNNIGLPLTLLELGPDHRWAVVELGMNAPGEIAALADICGPDIGVITNVAPAHLEGVGSIEGVMHAKGELLEKLDVGGTAILNADDPLVLRLAQKSKSRVLLFGIAPQAEIRAESIESGARDSRFELVLPGGRVQIVLKIPGAFMLSNALAAAAVGCAIGLSPAEIKAGLENFAPAENRMNILTTQSGIHVIDDTYNANPGSMAAALATLAALRRQQRAFFVTGDMRELGRQAQVLHDELGALCTRSGIDGLFATGEFAAVVGRGARQAGMDAAAIVTGTKKVLLQALRRTLRPGDWVLVKGSRAMAMEDIVWGLKQWSADR
ncbi:MAG: UDP-N-acetylmuramoyl-tripeptide--D-alanyl-D-alanine ligase [Desulfobacterales bacterium]